MIPPDWTKFILEYEQYRNVWIAFAIAPLGDTHYWFKGLGPTPDAAHAELLEHIRHGTHVGKPAAVIWNKSVGHIGARRPTVSSDEIFNSIELDL